MKLLVIAPLLAAVFTAFSISDVKRTADNTYTGTVSTVVNKTSKAKIPNNGDTVTVHTQDCTNVPTANESGLIVTGPTGSRLLFSNGTTCTVVDQKTN